MPRTKSPETLGPTLPVRFHPEDRKAIERAASETRLSEQDIVRQSVSIGLPALREALRAAKKQVA